MWHLGPEWNDERRLAEAWRAAAPFPHLVFDDFVPAAALPELLAVLEDQPVQRHQRDLFAFDATAPEPATAAFRDLGSSFGATLAPPLSRITGKPVQRTDLRGYLYGAGDHLLPHSDDPLGRDRLLAFAYYLPSPAPPVGGELELFRCTTVRGEIIATESTVRIEPRANRLVVFDVSDVSLHQVCEVIDGLRISLAGWFYA